MKEKGKIPLMKISSTAKYAIGVAAAAAMLAGCSSGASSLAPTTPSMGAQSSHGTQAMNFTAQVGLKGITVDSHPIAPQAKKAGQLLYISDSGTNEVETFAWPKPKTGSALSGSFSEPQGECADTKGNVYITNTGDENILEYSGTKLTNTISDPGQYPVGCSVDSKGDLAVSNIITTGDGAGSVTIYAGGKGSGKNYAITGLQRVYFLAYDKSTLWISGETSSYAVGFAQLNAKGKSQSKPITGGTIEFPGGVQFDGKNVTLGDQDGAVVYQMKKYAIVGSTPLTGSSDVVSYWIDQPTSQLIAPDAGNASVEIYAYPKGGSATQTLTGFSEPIGATVSAK
jgi:hypothetical protein